MQRTTRASACPRAWRRLLGRLPATPVLLAVALAATVVGGVPRVVLLQTAAQQGALLQVTRLDDVPPGTCEVDDCTLREALLAASAQAGPVTIAVPDGTVTLTQVGTGEDDGRTGDLDVRGDVTVIGQGAGRTTIDAAPLRTAGAADRVWDVHVGRLHLRAVTVTGGAADVGGGVRVAPGALLDLTDAALVGNGADQDGGAVRLDRSSTLTGQGATLAGNTAGAFGGGLSADRATVVLARSTVSGNGAAVDGGGIAVTDGDLTLESSTLSGNIALGSGGGALLEGGRSTISHATVTGNTAAVGPGLLPVGATVVVGGSALAGNGVAGGDCDLTFGTLGSAGGNLADVSCALGGAGDRVPADPADPLKVGPLADNGGPTDTHLPAAGSPLVDALDTCPPADQRGATRPADGDGDGVSRCDIGAVERNAVVPAAGGPGGELGGAAGPGTAPPGTQPTTPPTPGASTAEQDRVRRLAGAERIATAIAISREAFPDGMAATAVLARADEFADALAGTPLAVRRGGPLLLSTVAALPAEVAAELTRAVVPGGTVVLLGGTAALGPEVAEAVAALGFRVERIAGPDRFATSVAIAVDGLGDPEVVLLASGADFPDAVAAGAAAAAVDGAVLLTDGSRLPDVVAEHLDAGEGEAGRRTTAVGGPAARARPDAAPLVGSTRVETAVLVAETFFLDPPAVGIATARAFPDALAGGSLLGRLGGPVLLSEPGGLPDVVADHLRGGRSRIRTAYVLGGTAALSPTVETDITEALR